MCRHTCYLVAVMSNFMRFHPRDGAGGVGQAGLGAGGMGSKPANDNGAVSPILRPSSPPPALGFRKLQPMTNARLHATFMDVRDRLDSTFINRRPLLTCGDMAFTQNGIAALGVLTASNMYLVGTRGSGKTVLAETLRRSVFGDRGFYLRGDPDMRLKDLYTTLNLNGKTDEEIYRVAKTIEFCFALIDEMNRIPGIVQNQFLNFFDGYIEIRGQKYPLGTGNYMLAVGTGNPTNNGDHPGVFEEDIALLDRIPLILNVDEVEHADGDIAAIMLADLNKNDIPLSDMTDEVLSAYSYLRGKRKKELEFAATIALLSEFAYNELRYVRVADKKLDKAQDQSWRDKLQGEHNGGKMISYASDVSVRTLKQAASFGFAVFQMASIESELMKTQGASTKSVGFDEFVSSFINSLKLGLTYDRRFIPSELPEMLEKTHSEMLDGVFGDLSSAIDRDSFQDASVLLADFLKAMQDGRANEAQKIMAKTAKEQMASGTPSLATAQGIMNSLFRERERAKRNAILRKAHIDAA